MKSALECSNEDGTYNIARMKQEHQEELNGLRERSRLELQQEKTKIINEYEVKISSQEKLQTCLLYTSPSPRDQRGPRMPSSA